MWCDVVIVVTDSTMIKNYDEINIDYHHLAIWGIIFVPRHLTQQIPEMP